MATTISFPWENVTPGESIQLTQLNLGTGYTHEIGLKEGKYDVTKHSNLTTPDEQQEVITLRFRRIPKVDTSDKFVVRYPAPVTTGVSYSATLEVSKRKVEDDGDTTDHPIVCQISLRHESSADITDADIVEVLRRTLSVLFSNSGANRFDHLRRGAIQITTD